MARRLKKYSMKMKSSEVLAWIKYQYYFVNMDLKETFDTIIAADYLENEGLSKAMLKKFLFTNNDKDVEEAANQYENGIIVRLLDDFKRCNEVVVSLQWDVLKSWLKYFDPNTSQMSKITVIPRGVQFGWGRRFVP